MVLSPAGSLLLFFLEPPSLLFFFFAFAFDHSLCLENSSCLCAYCCLINCLNLICS